MKRPDIEAIKARVKAMQPGDHRINRYDHGGGRMWIEDGESRHLVADTYQEGDREFFALARPDMIDLIAYIEHLEARLEAKEPTCKPSLQAEGSPAAIAKHGPYNGGGDIEQAASRTQSFFAVCENDHAEMQSYVFDTQGDYTSETEDLSTWPETRGKEWRRMEGWEVMQKGDAFCNQPDQMGFYVDGFIGGLASNVAGEYAQVWTRRPPQTKGEG